MLTARRCLFLVTVFNLCSAKIETFILCFFSIFARNLCFFPIFAQNLCSPCPFFAPLIFPLYIYFSSFKFKFLLKGLNLCFSSILAQNLCFFQFWLRIFAFFQSWLKILAQLFIAESKTGTGPDNTTFSSSKKVLLQFHHIYFDLTVRSQREMLSVVEE